MTDATKRPGSKSPVSQRPSLVGGGPPSSQRDPSTERGCGFVWLLAPHAGRIRATAIGSGGTLGKAEEATLKIDAPGIAPVHAKVDLVARAPGTPPEIYVTDMGTASGTYVSGMRAQRTVLHDGDLLRVGGATALVVERDVGSYDGAVVDDGGLVRSARSRRGWYAQVEKAMAEPRDGKRAVVVSGPSGAGRRSVVRRIAEAWGVLRAGEAEGYAMPAIDLDVAAGGVAEDAIPAAMAAASKHGAVVLRDLDKSTPAQQAAITAALQGRAGDFAVFAVMTDLAALTAFSPELSAQLGSLRVELVSLEQRREEIPTLVRGRFEKAGVASHRLSIELYEALTRAAWPGDIEELVESVDRIAAAHPDVPRLGPEHLVKPLARRGGRVPLQAAPLDALSEADRIRAALVEAKGSVAAAARALHLSRQALYREAARLGIDIRRTRETDGDNAA